jgi:hypothetical protein
MIREIVEHKDAFNPFTPKPFLATRNGLYLFRFQLPDFILSNAFDATGRLD